MNNGRSNAQPLPKGRIATRILPILLLLLGTALRISMLTREVHFHPDEALYATYARSMALDGNWLLREVVVPLDKPPLGISLTALGFLLTGVSEFSGRWPTVFISLLTLAAAYGLGRRLYDRRTALIILLLLAISPFDLAFAATLFHDPSLTLWLVLTAWGLASGHWRLAGITAALSLWTKQSAIQFLPVFVLIGLSRVQLAAWTWRSGRRFLTRFVVMLAIGITLLVVWSATRAVPTDFWTLGVVNPGALRLIRSDEVLPRLVRWLDPLHYAVGTAPILLLAALPLLLLKRSHGSASAALTDVVIVVGVIGTLLLYWLVAYNTYDRYLHPLVVLIVCLVARALSRLHIAITWIVVLLILPVTWQALHSQIEVGVQPGVADGIAALAADIKALPHEALVHQYWMDWELGYYLGDPAAAPLPTLVFQPSPEALAKFVCAHDDRINYLSLPRTLAPRWLAVLNREHVTFTTLLDAQFALYAVHCTLPTDVAADR